ncbi:hypothetical protein D2V17_15115 [Aurantiacibacter xanthus]|uniref:Uncharacterized protein n=1 Tax=Aurantiacibacter xanthus TaxID=1784712 RepID=A0A3A1P6D3_9SPHN|nr:hypothetical protein [Aurantiacibacter xanthus]RIV82641.1 hypothetical protein D2V17_15115 [Aurantiacibacter xanthus]
MTTIYTYGGLRVNRWLCCPVLAGSAQDQANPHAGMTNDQILREPLCEQDDRIPHKGGNGRPAATGCSFATVATMLR